MNMTMLLVIVLVGITTTNAFLDETEYGDSLGSITKSTHDKCTVITGVTEEEVNNLKHGIIPDEEKPQRYLLCIWILTGQLKPNLELDLAILEEMTPVVMVGTGRQLYTGCLEEAKKSGPREPYKILGRMVRCYYHKEPEHYIMF